MLSNECIKLTQFVEDSLAEMQRCAYTGNKKALTLSSPHNLQKLGSQISKKILEFF